MFGKKHEFAEKVKDKNSAYRAPENYLQRRSAEIRTSHLKMVKIIFNNRYSVFDAILRSLSENGAKIEVDETLHLPDTFLMESPCGEISKKCRRTWKDNRFIGIEFVDL